jgi:hypothetical protein
LFLIQVRGLRELVDTISVVAFFCIQVPMYLYPSPGT